MRCKSYLVSPAYAITRFPSTEGYSTFSAYRLFKVNFRFQRIRPRYALCKSPCFRLTAPFLLSTWKRTQNHERDSGKLLRFRCDKLDAARKLAFDAAGFAMEIQDLASGLARATPDDIELQGGVFDLLRGEDAEVRSARWTEMSGVILRCHRPRAFQDTGEAYFISDLADIAKEMLQERGEVDVDIVAATFGKRLSHWVLPQGEIQGQKVAVKRSRRYSGGRLRQNLKGLTARPIIFRLN